MRITIDLLRKHDACEQGIKYVERFYPEGVEMIEIIHDSRINKELLHWGREHLANGPEELEAYCVACNIVNTEGHWYSQDVLNSKYVIKSKQVNNCVGVFGSMEVTNSSDVIDSESILDSKQVFNSTMVDESEKIFKGQNITRSINICNSIMVVDSKNIIDSSEIFDSSEIIKCANVSNSFFCQNCKNITHCMFCEGLEDAEYHLFNKPVDKKYFELFEKQYLRYMIEGLDFVREWPKDIIVSASVTPTRKFDDWYHSISQRFWKWARTLPNFDSMLIYNITMSPEFL